MLRRYIVPKGVVSQFPICPPPPLHCYDFQSTEGVVSNVFWTPYMVCKCECCILCLCVPRGSWQSRLAKSQVYRKGRWTDLVLLTRWHTSKNKIGERTRQCIFSNWPKSDAPVWEVGNVAPRRATPTLHDVEALSRALRLYSPVVLSQRPDARPTLEHNLRMLDSWKEGMFEIASATWAPVSRNDGYSSLQIASALKASLTVRGSLRQAITELAPLFSVGASSVQAVLDSIPSKFTLDRYAVAFDAALMLTRRNMTRTKGNCVRWLSCDSSPQCNYDWLWSTYIEAPTQMLPELLRAACDIERNPPWKHEAVDLRSVDLRARRDATSFLVSSGAGNAAPLFELLGNNFDRHICVPAGLAGGFSGVVHKCAALLHSWNLELDASSQLLDYESCCFYSAAPPARSSMSIDDKRFCVQESP